MRNISWVVVLVLVVAGCDRGGGDDPERPDPNTAPTAADIALSGDQGETITILLQGDDADGDPLSYSVEQPPAVGTLSALTGTTLSYTAPDGWQGVDRFTYVVSDGQDRSDPATVTLTVRYIGERDPQLISTAVVLPVLPSYQGVVAEACLASAGEELVFTSRARGLVTGDSDDWQDVFRYELGSHALQRVSVATDGSQGQGDSREPAASGDAQVIAFVSDAANLVSGDDAGFADVFVRDIVGGSTSRVSVASDGSQADAASSSPSLSDDGRLVAFVSRAGNLVAGDTNGVADVFVHDRQTGVTRRVSEGVLGQANAACEQAMISGDGNWLVFTSRASNLVGGDDNGVADVFRVNVSGGQIQRVSLTSDGGEADVTSDTPSISRDGLRVAFRSDARLAEGSAGIFVRDLAQGETWLVSRDASGPAPGYVAEARISADGEHVVFTAADSLDGADSNGRLDVYARDLAGARTRLVSVDAEGQVGAGDSRSGSIDANGTIAVCLTAAAGVVGEGFSFDDVVIRLLDAEATSGVRLDGTAGGADGPSAWSSISADGRVVAFASSASNLIEDDSNAHADVFAYDVTTGAMQRLSQAADGRQSLAPAGTPALSDDARFLAFLCRDVSLAGSRAGDHPAQILLHDLSTGILSLASPSIVGGPAGGACFAPAVSADGRYTVFASDAADLVNDDGNGLRDVFLYDRADAIIERVSLANSGAEANGASHEPVISGDGRYIAFASDADNLIAADGNGLRDVFVYDRSLGTMRRLSEGAGGLDPDGVSDEPAIAADGAWVAFVSAAGNLIAGDSNGVRDVFVVPVAGGMPERISAAASGGSESADSTGPSLSRNGNLVVFSTVSALVTADGNDQSDVYLHRRDVDTLIRVSVSANAGDAAGASWEASLAADGSAVSFTTTADDIAGGRTGVRKVVRRLVAPLATN